MNFKQASFTLIAFSLVVFASSRTVVADGVCQKVKGFEIGVLNPDGTGATGMIVKGGRLNGPTSVVLASPFVPTGDPHTFSFTDNFTLTTVEGVLRTHNVSLFDVANGLSTAVARIDPNTSEGVFAGATGSLFINGRSTSAFGNFEAEITGEVCFAELK